MKAFSIIYTRDLKLSVRKLAECANPLVFFAIIATLFPLAMDPTVAVLNSLGVAVVWVGALLASLLALDGLFRQEAEDGSLEQLLLSPVPLGVIVIAKCCAHWSVAALPLVIIAPVLGMAFRLPAPALVVLTVALLLATPALSILVALGAALTVNLKSGSSIIGILVLPLCAPLLIFGARATDLALGGEAVAAPLYFLAAFSVFAVSLGPLAIGAALRVSSE